MRLPSWSDSPTKIWPNFSVLLRKRVTGHLCRNGLTDTTCVLPWNSILMGHLLILLVRLVCKWRKVCRICTLTAFCTWICLLATSSTTLPTRRSSCVTLDWEPSSLLALPRFKKFFFFFFVPSSFSRKPLMETLVTLPLKSWCASMTTFHLPGEEKRVNWKIVHVLRFLVMSGVGDLSCTRLPQEAPCKPSCSKFCIIFQALFPGLARSSLLKSVAKSGRLVIVPIWRMFRLARRIDFWDCFHVFFIAGSQFVQDYFSVLEQVCCFSSFSCAADQRLSNTLSFWRSCASQGAQGFILTNLFPFVSEFWHASLHCLNQTPSTTAIMLRLLPSPRFDRFVGFCLTKRKKQNWLAFLGWWIFGWHAQWFGQDALRG